MSFDLLGWLLEQMMDGMFSSSSPRLQEKPGVVVQASATGATGSDSHLPSAVGGDALNETIGSVTSGTGQDPHHHRGESPDDVEKEERRRAAHKVLGKQG